MKACLSMLYYAFDFSHLLISFRAMYACIVRPAFEKYSRAMPLLMHGPGHVLHQRVGEPFFRDHSMFSVFNPFLGWPGLALFS